MDVAYWHLADMAFQPADVCYWGQNGHGPAIAGCPLMTIADVRYLLFFNGFAVSRAPAMKSCASGLSVRFRKVRSRLDKECFCRAGSSLSGKCLPNRNIESRKHREKPTCS